MSLIIKGMEMPKDGPLIFKINPDGAVSTTWKNGYKKYTAVPVPPHGRLIDADALLKEFDYGKDVNWRDLNESLVHKTGIWAEIQCAPTIFEEDG